VDTVDFDTTSGGVSGTGTVTAVHVGSTGDGVLELGNGATIAADSLDAGIAATAAGQIGLFGAGTELIVAGALTVGDAGDGRLSISPGATVTAGSLDEAAAAGGSGGISLSGTGAALNVAGALSVGDRSSGSLNIANGAIVTAGSLTIGAGGSGSGNVVIGPGSHLNLTGTTINVGLAGSAVLDIQGGTLGLASGTTLSPGTFGRIVQVGGLIDPGATLDLSGASLGGDGTVEASVEILNTSLVTISGESETLLTPLITSGDTVNIAGVWSIKTGGTLVLDANTVDNSQTISFGDLTGALVIGQQVTLDATQTPVPIAASAFGGFAAPIVGYKTGDMIAFTGLTVASDSVTGNVVTLFDAQNVTLGTLTFQTAKGGADNAGAIAAAAQIACFAAGTLIETVAGPRAVETLRIGDDVVTLPGAPGRIVWVGARRVDCARHPRPETVWPVRIARHAFGENVPARDLFVSPDHAIYVDGVLIPAKLLLNGTTIRQVRCRRVAYHHVELARHDVILAEGLPAETYLDTGDRAKFTGGHVTMPHPDFTARMWEALGCAPLFVTGPRLDAVRRCVNARAAEQAPHPPGVLDPAIRHGAVLPDRMIGQDYRSQ